MKLTDKQKKFCKQYLIDLNGTQAAIRAGYSKKTANRIASENLSKPDIQEYLQVIRQKDEIAMDVTREKIIKEYASIAFCDIREFYDDDGNLKNIKDLSEEAAAALAGIEADELFEGYGEDKVRTGISKKIKRWDKVKALDSLCKVFGYNMAEKHEHDFGKTFLDFLKESRLVQ